MSNHSVRKVSKSKNNSKKRNSRKKNIRRKRSNTRNLNNQNFGLKSVFKSKPKYKIGNPKLISTTNTHMPFVYKDYTREDIPNLKIDSPKFHRDIYNQYEKNYGPLKRIAPPLPYKGSWVKLPKEEEEIKFIKLVDQNGNEYYADERDYMDYEV